MNRHNVFTGFDHEHNRHDRDEYITLTDTTPGSCATFNYANLSAGEEITYGHDYDYCSVMHYARNRKCTLIPKNTEWSCNVNGNYITDIGQRYGLSPKGDIPDINARYCLEFGEKTSAHYRTRYYFKTYVGYNYPIFKHKNQILFS